MSGAAGPYVLGEPLGRGGQGTMFRAVDPATNTPVALKRFRLADAAGWKGYDLFVRECDALRSLSHPAIPRFLGAGGDHAAGELWLAMELVEGESLAELLRRGHAFAADDITRIARALCEVLGYLHARLPPVIHRDIKPANVIVAAPDGRARVALVDFGSVRVALKPEGGTTVVGTFGYFAPEQLHGEATARSDLYALGVTIASLASGLEATALPRAGLAIDVARALPAAPAPLCEFVRALTRPEPGERPASAAEALALLAAPVPAVFTPASPAPISPPQSAPAPMDGPYVPWVVRLPIRVALLMMFIMLGIAHATLPTIYRAQRRGVLAEARRDGDRARAARRLERIHRREARLRERLAHARAGLLHARQRVDGYAPRRLERKR